MLIAVNQVTSTFSFRYSIPICTLGKGGVRTGATGAIAPVDFGDFHNLLSKN